MTIGKRTASHWLLALLLSAGALLSAGCNTEPAADQAASTDDQSAAASGEEGESAAGAGETSESADSKAPANRTSAVGKWIIVLSQRGRDWGLASLEILPEDAGEAAERVKVLQPGMALGSEVEVTSAEVEDRRLHLELMFGETPAVFDGFLVNGQFRGSILLGASRSDPARLIPTNDESLGDYQEGPPSPGRKEFDTAVNSQSPYRELAVFVKDFPNSPLALNAYHQMLALAGERKLTEEGVRNLANDYLNTAERWGERMREMARINTGLQLVGTGYLPELGLEYLEEAEANFTDETRSAWQMLIDNGRREAKLAMAREKADDLAEQIADSDEPLPEAIQSLRELAAEHPSDPLIAYSLAMAELKSDNKDEALEAFARLSVLPQMELIVQSELSQAGQTNAVLPSETTAKLWKELHGDTDGLDDYLSKVYEEHIVAFAEESAEAGEGNRVNLVELFTGAQCPPCVAADVATAGLEKTYPREDVIVLRYHQHVPGPDPLTNPEAEARFSYYQAEGTPTVALNGVLLEGNVGGFIIHAPMIYDELRGHLSHFLDDSTPVKIELSAEANQADVKIEAKAEGLPENAGSPRLRLALVEDDIHFVASNGIRRHEWTVRSMPGGPEGIGPSGNGFEYSETISLQEIREALETYLTKFEEGTGSEFISKPMEMKSLHLVAFVQDDDSGEILQAAAVPVQGEISYPEPSAAPTPPSGDDETAETAAPASAVQPANVDGAAGEDAAAPPALEVPPPAAEKPADEQPKPDEPADKTEANDSEAAPREEKSGENASSEGGPEPDAEKENP